VPVDRMSWSETCDSAKVRLGTDRGSNGDGFSRTSSHGEVPVVLCSPLIRPGRAVVSLEARAGPPAWLIEPCSTILVTRSLPSLGWPEPTEAASTVSLAGETGETVWKK
jgi:hypothetical protein